MNTTVADRFQLNVLAPGLTYRGGARGEKEWTVWGELGNASVTGWNADGDVRFSGRSSNVGGAYHHWLNPRMRLTGGADVFWSGGRSEGRNMHNVQSSVHVGYSAQLTQALTLHVGATYLAPSWWTQDFDFEVGDGTALRVGSGFHQGQSKVPLLQYSVSDRTSLDLHADVEFRGRTVNDSYLLGFTHLWGKAYR